MDKAIGASTPDVEVASTSLDTERVVHVVFNDGREHSYTIAELPFATGAVASEARIVADGDAIEIIAPSGDFEVMADELAAIAEAGVLESSGLAKQIGAAVRGARQERGLVLRDVEALTGIAVPNLSAMEAGRSLPRLDTLTRVAAALHMTVADLVSLASSSMRAWRPAQWPPPPEQVIQLRRSPYKFHFYDQDRASEHEERLRKALELFPERGKRNELYLWLDEAFDALADLQSLWAEIATSLDKDAEHDEQLRELIANLSRRIGETDQMLRDRETLRIQADRDLG